MTTFGCWNPVSLEFICPVTDPPQPFFISQARKKSWKTTLKIILDMVEKLYGDNNKQSNNEHVWKRILVYLCYSVKIFIGKEMLNQEEDFVQIFKRRKWPLYYFSECSTNDCYTQQLRWSKQTEIWGNQDIGIVQGNRISFCVSEQCSAKLYLWYHLWCFNKGKAITEKWKVNIFKIASALFYTLQRTVPSANVVSMKYHVNLITEWKYNCVQLCCTKVHLSYACGAAGSLFLVFIPVCFQGSCGINSIFLESLFFRFYL